MRLIEKMRGPHQRERRPLRRGRGRGLLLLRWRGDDRGSGNRRSARGRKQRPFTRRGQGAQWNCPQRVAGSRSGAGIGRALDLWRGTGGGPVNRTCAARAAEFTRKASNGRISLMIAIANYPDSSL
jgi:hypothetical protein